jgi:predicted SPOUT superfamily RNA methylase MTH1
MQGEELPIALILVLGVSGLYFGYEVDRRRKRLHSIFNTFDKEESRIATALEAMVESGRLKPYSFIAQA